MIKKTFLSILLSILFIPTFVFGYSDYLIVGGENIGINIKTDGVMVVGTYSKTTSKLKNGDIILKVNNNDVHTIDELMNVISLSGCEDIFVSYRRNNNDYSTILDVYEENNVCKTGLYVKDSITGIGTLTYIDPNTKIFGALGHEIIEKNTGLLIETKSGTIFNSEVLNIERSVNGKPGEKNARYFSTQVNGSIYENTKKGIFGMYTSDINTNKLYKVAKNNEIKKGEAIIRTVINGNEINEYSIVITKINDKQDTKNISFDITDERLLKETGGIVQGMSGSPIIQGDYIIGAVTHVVVENPSKGYGIFITNMLEESEN